MRKSAPRRENNTPGQHGSRACAQGLLLQAGQAPDSLTHNRRCPLERELAGGALSPCPNPLGSELAPSVLFIQVGPRYAWKGEGKGKSLKMQPPRWGISGQRG